MRQLFCRSWLVTLRRLLMLMVTFVAVGYLAYYAREWEMDFYGCTKIYVPLAIVSIIGSLGVLGMGLLWLVYIGLRRWIHSRRAARKSEEAAQDESSEEGVQLELPLSYPPPAAPSGSLLKRRWDIWLAAGSIVICVPLCYLFCYLAAGRSELTVSCPGPHGDDCVALAAWTTTGAAAEGVKERQPSKAPYLHTFYLPDGDFNVSCKSGATSFAISHIRKTRRFTLKPRFNIEGEIDLYICPIVQENDRRRVQTLLQYHVQNPQTRRPRIRRMPFTKCQDAAVLYLDYGEYVLLPVPVGTEFSEAPALIYLSLRP